MPRCFLGLGGNTGDVQQTFIAVLSDLGEPDPDHPKCGRVSVVGMSRIYRTSPIGAEAGGEFLNAAIEIDTDLPPHELLDLVQSLEAAHGRIADIRWSPRPIDIDLLLYGDRVIDDARLTVPHPACWYRRFVLDPLVEIAADVVHPVQGITIGELRARLMLRPFRLRVAGADERSRSHLVGTLRGRFPQVEFDEWPAGPNTPKREATIVAWLGPDDRSGTGAVDWDSLPKISRLDASMTRDDAVAFLADVLRSALDEPVPLER